MSHRVGNPSQRGSEFASSKEGQRGQAGAGPGHDSKILPVGSTEWKREQARWFRLISFTHKQWCQCKCWRDHFGHPIQSTVEAATNTEPEEVFDQLYRSAEASRIRGIKRGILKENTSAPFPKRRKKKKSVSWADTHKKLPIATETTFFPEKTPRSWQKWQGCLEDDGTSSDEEDGDTTDDTDDFTTEGEEEGDTQDDLIRLLSGPFSTSTPESTPYGSPIPTTPSGSSSGASSSYPSHLHQLQESGITGRVLGWR